MSLTENHQQIITDYLVHHQLDEFLNFLLDKTRHQQLESIEFFLTQYFSYNQKVYCDQLFFEKLDTFMVEKDLYSQITWYLSIDGIKNLLSIFKKNKLYDSLEHLINALPQEFTQITQFFSEDIKIYYFDIYHIVLKHLQKTQKQDFLFNNNQDAYNFYYGTDKWWGFLYTLLNNVEKEEILNNLPFYESLLFDFYHFLKHLKYEANNQVQTFTYLENTLYLLSLPSNAVFKDKFVYLLTEYMNSSERTYKDFVTIIDPIYKINKKLNGCFIDSGEFLRKIAIASLGVNRVFSLEKEENENYYKKLFSNIIYEPEFSITKDSILFILKSAITPQIINKNDSKWAWASHTFMCELFEQLLFKTNVVNLNEMQGFNFLTIYLYFIDSINKNKTKLNNQNFSFKDWHALEFSYLDIIYEKSPHLFLEQDKAGKYPWEYLHQHALTEFDSKGYSHPIYNTLEQFEYYLKIKGLFNEYILIKTSQEVGALNKMAQKTKKIFSYFKKEKKDLVLIQNNTPTLLDKLTVFQREIEKIEINEGNQNVLDKFKMILSHIQENFDLISQLEINDENSYFLTQCIEVYLPSILNNYINSQKFNQHSSMFNQVALEQLEMLSQKVNLILNIQTDSEAQKHLEKMQTMTQFLSIKA